MASDSASSPPPKKRLKSETLTSPCPTTLSSKSEGKQKLKEVERIIDPRAEQSSSSANLESKICGICWTEEGKVTRGRIDSCDHFFCFVCITEWAKIESQCPLCKRPFSSILRPSKEGVFGCERVFQVPARLQTTAQPSSLSSLTATIAAIESSLQYLRTTQDAMLEELRTFIEQPDPPTPTEPHARTLADYPTAWALHAFMQVTETLRKSVEDVMRQFNTYLEQCSSFFIALTTVLQEMTLELEFSLALFPPFPNFSAATHDSDANSSSEGTITDEDESQCAGPTMTIEDNPNQAIPPA